MDINSSNMFDMSDDFGPAEVLCTIGTAVAAAWAGAHSPAQAAATAVPPAPATTLAIPPAV